MSACEKPPASNSALQHEIEVVALGGNIHHHRIAQAVFGEETVEIDAVFFVGGHEVLLKDDPTLF